MGNSINNNNNWRVGPAPTGATDLGAPPAKPPRPPKHLLTGQPGPGLPGRVNTSASLPPQQRMTLGQLQAISQAMSQGGQGFGTMRMPDPASYRTQVQQAEPQGAPAFPSAAGPQQTEPQFLSNGPGLKRHDRVKPRPTPIRQDSMSSIASTASNASTISTNSTISTTSTAPTEVSLESNGSSKANSAKQFAKNLGGFFKTAASSAKQQIGKLGGPSLTAAEIDAANLAKVNVERTKIATEILLEKSGKLSDIDLSDVQSKLSSGNGILLGENNGALRRIATTLEASIKASDLASVPAHLRDHVESLQNFYANQDVKDHLIQSGTKEWHRQEPSAAQISKVMDQAITAQLLLGALNRANERGW
ncbi:hypothetical protein HLB44_15725 [Aquincola sp. S2]|uniref:Uncharacterized protein n=1 Tax=Pseudaquabacterium terrae TaxID=2732868 RepID=A0ABX2EIK1_9BURK|nr:hypothetical protein [Aquabacterium terrae]NRF68444.1 hypothetical protein [Aquabacterium terrae]